MDLTGWASINRGGRIIKGRVPGSAPQGKTALPGNRTQPGMALRADGKFGPNTPGPYPAVPPTPNRMLPDDARQPAGSQSPGEPQIARAASQPVAPPAAQRDPEPTQTAKRTTIPADPPEERRSAKVLVSRLAPAGRTDVDVWLTNTGNAPAVACSAEATLTRGARKINRSISAGTIAPGEVKKVTIATRSLLSAVQVSVQAKCRNATSVAKQM